MRVQGRSVERERERVYTQREGLTNHILYPRMTLQGHYPLHAKGHFAATKLKIVPHPLHFRLATSHNITLQ